MGGGPHRRQRRPRGRRRHRPSGVGLGREEVVVDDALDEALGTGVMHGDALGSTTARTSTLKLPQLIFRDDFVSNFM